MSADKRELTRLVFEGPRFDDHGLDFDALTDLIAYKDLLVKTAVGLWWAKHPDRQRIDRGFEDSIRLKFFEIGAGSRFKPGMVRYGTVWWGKAFFVFWVCSILCWVARNYNIEGDCNEQNNL